MEKILHKQFLTTFIVCAPRSRPHLTRLKIKGVGRRANIKGAKKSSLILGCNDSKLCVLDVTLPPGSLFSRISDMKRYLYTIKLGAYKLKGRYEVTQTYKCEKIKGSRTI